jgi:alpha-2-macroglobulin
VVRALAAVRADDPLIDPALRWLLANRMGGTYWMSTKQTAMVLYGLLAVLEQRAQRPGPVTVTIVAGDRTETIALGPDDWTSAVPKSVTLPAGAGSNAVRISAAGGTAYWTATARYYDTAEGLERTGSRQLALSRRYFTLAPVTKGARVVYEERPFTGVVAPGDLILVRLVVAGSNDWRYLMIEDPIPAGTEAVSNPRTLELARPPSWTFGSHREYRDDRVALFLQQLNGRAEFAYLLRATTPGRFRAMPAQVSPMYVPGVVASSAAASVEVSSPAEGAQP